MTEHRWALAIAVAATVIGGLAYGVSRWADDSTAVLTTVIAVATVAYSGFTWRIVVSGERDREAARTGVEEARQSRLRSLRIELGQNANRKGYTRGHGHIHARLERSAFDAARGDFHVLPIQIQIDLTKLDGFIAGYNGFVEHNMHMPLPGNLFPLMDQFADDACDKSAELAVTLEGQDISGGRAGPPPGPLPTRLGV